MVTEFPVSEVLPDAPSVPLFAQLAGATLARCKETYSNRGDQYGDTWRDCQWLKLKAILFTMFGLKPTIAQCRVMSLAALSDIKYSRFLGGYNDDHVIDGINYDAALAEEMREVYKEPARAINVTVPANVPVEYRWCGKPEKVQVRVNGEWKDL